MLRQFLWWLLSVLVLLAIFILLKGKVEIVIWIMVAWFVFGSVRQVIRARKSQPDTFSAPAPPFEPQNQFDPEFCGRLTRIAAICFLAMVGLEFVFFLTVKSTKCPGWQAPTEKQGGSVWVLWAFATFWTLNISYHAVTWRRFSRRITDHIDWARQTYVPGTNPSYLTDPTQFRARCAVKNDANGILIIVLIGSALFVALPALTRIGCF
jgi:cellulose synthase/poly-beta-1,6-N-acetylglucosamine synthase-like glycosyltransferase